MIAIARASLILLTVLAAMPGVAAAEVRATDDAGREVVLDAPADRIISLAPNITETLFAAGAGGRIVATVNYSDHPEAARAIPRIGGYNQLNLEAIMARDPDLVVGWISGNPERQIERLRELDIPVYMSEARRPRDVAATMRRLGALAGTEDRAAAAADAFIERFNRLRERHAGRAPVGVFYQVWNEPLMTINGEHMISSIIRGCGGRNVFADLPALAPRIDEEAVLARDPEFILASGMGDERPDWLDEWREWPELQAVERDNLYFIPPSIIQRQTTRILDGMERLCGQIEAARAKRPGG